MVEYRSQQLDTTFAALADPTRRALLARLSTGSASVGDLAAPFRVSMQAISKHLKVLERAKLIRKEKDGRVRRMHLEARPLQEANEWIETYRGVWERQFDRLAQFLDDTAPEDGAGGAS